MAEDLYNRVFAHIREDGGNTTLNTRLFEEAELILPAYLTGTPELLEKRQSLMRYLAADLTDTRRPDQTSIVNLLIKLFEGWSWQQVCDFGTQSVPYKDGLAVGDGMVAFNRLMLCLLGKATKSASDAGHAASMLETMLALVRLWLTTGETGVSTQAGDLLYQLLKADPPVAVQSGGGGGGRGVPPGAQGLVWKRIFGDRDVYHVFFESCSLQHGLSSLSKNQKTVAQARLMDWLPKVAALNWGAVSRSHHKEVEEKYKFQGGLLDFAALYMVDYKDDVLLHQCLVDFFSDLLRATAKLDTHTMPQHDSMGLQYLIMHGLHARTAAIYLQVQPVDPVDAMFLYGPAANYLAVYAQEYPKHFLAGQMPAQVNERLLHTLDLTPGKWAHSDSPKHDLHLLASLPRQALLPFSGSAVALLPSKSTNADVLNTFATIFHGPSRQTLTFPSTASPTAGASKSEQETEEGSAARALYFNYLSTNPRFWQDITSHADTVALKDLALAAINLLTTVIIANWSTESSHELPSTLAAPASGHLAILSPPALEYTLPYLLKPPITYANLVGGRGDTESSAYKVAAAKFDALRALEARVRTQVEMGTDEEGFEEILGTLGKRVAQGVVPRGAELGGAVGVMEL